MSLTITGFEKEKLNRNLNALTELVYNWDKKKLRFVQDNTLDDDQPIMQLWARMVVEKTSWATEQLFTCKLNQKRMKRELLATEIEDMKKRKKLPGKEGHKQNEDWKKIGRYFSQNEMKWFKIREGNFQQTK